MSFEKDIKEVQDEILRIKQDSKVVSTTTTFVHEQRLTLPTDTFASFKSFRAKVVYHDTGQPVFSTISIKKVGEDYYTVGNAAKTAITNHSQYFWINVLGSTAVLPQRDVVIIATAPIQSIELALE